MNRIWNKNGSFKLVYFVFQLTPTKFYFIIFIWYFGTFVLSSSILAIKTVASIVFRYAIPCVLLCVFLFYKYFNPNTYYMFLISYWVINNIVKCVSWIWFIYVIILISSIQYLTIVYVILIYLINAIIWIICYANW